MPNPPEKEPQHKENGIPQMPFDDALRHLLKAPPQHKTVKKPQQKKPNK
jgi:hypothetical protein